MKLMKKFLFVLMIFLIMTTCVSNVTADVVKYDNTLEPFSSDEYTCGHNGHEPLIVTLKWPSTNFNGLVLTVTEPNGEFHYFDKSSDIVIKDGIACYFKSFFQSGQYKILVGSVCDTPIHYDLKIEGCL